MAENNVNDEFTILSKAAKILRDKMFSHSSSNFNGTFPVNCQTESLPPILSSFMQMLLDGPGITQNLDPEAPAVVSSGGSAAALTLSQLTMFNTVKKRSSCQGAVPRHVKDRETPLPIYLAVKIYGVTRSKTLVNTLHKYGLSISYSRLQRISTDMANSVIHHYESEGVVVPLQALKGVFTVVCKDNIDKNTRSTTARSNFHGDCYSIQQFPTHENPGEPIEYNYMNEEVMGKSSVDPLPGSYTNIKAGQNNKEQWDSYKGQTLNEDSI